MISLPKNQIRVKPPTQKRLDATIDHLKKHRKGRVTYDDAISHLFNKIKELKSKIRDLEQAKPQPSMQDKEVSMVPESPSDAGMQCPFWSDAGSGWVHCAKDQDRKGVIHKVSQEVCNLCYVRIQQRMLKNKELAEKLDCLSRYEEADIYFCVKNPPKAVRLEHGLKTCQACTQRLTKEKAHAQGLVLRTHTYVTCGAKEHRDSKNRLMFYCTKQGGTWIDIEYCKNIKCPHVKTVQTS